MLIAALLTASFAHAFYEESQSTLGHRVYLNPDVFYNTSDDATVKYKFLKNEDKTNKDESTKISRKTKGLAVGLRGGYEYYAPNYIYGGVEGTYAIGSVDYTRTGKEKGVASPTIHASSDVDFFNYEGRLGYTFEEDQIVVTPFLGAGLGWIHPESSDTPIPRADFGYLAAGGRLKLAVDLNVDLGVNFQLLRSIVGKQTSVDDSSPNKVRTKAIHQWGYEAAVPFTWHTDDSRWNVQVEPYLFQLPTRAEDLFLGTQLSLGHAF